MAALGFLWTYPESVDDTRGLGGGIAWAWDEDGLCGPDGILGLFREDLFSYDLVGCEDLRAAMNRAFASWSDNHRAIKFVDVTHQCKALHGVVAEDCELVELWVTARRTAAQANVEGTIEAASASPTPELTFNFRYTNGQQPHRWRSPTATLPSPSVPPDLTPAPPFPPPFPPSPAASPPFEAIPVIETVHGVISFGISNCWWRADVEPSQPWTPLMASTGHPPPSRARP